MWSPLGTYLATLHPQGVKLWSGPNWADSGVQRFPHKNVRLLDFSRNERYLATFSPDPISLRELDPRMRSIFSEDDEGNNIVIWDIKTGNLLRTFSANVSEGSKMAWPVFKWSSDDRYVARVTPGQQISVYELPDMGLLDKKSIKIEGVVDFDWSPADEREDEKEKDNATKSAKGKKPRENMLAYWTPEMGNQPARVSLISIPSRTVLRTKNLFNVNDVSFLILFHTLHLSFADMRCPAWEHFSRRFSASRCRMCVRLVLCGGTTHDMTVRRARRLRTFDPSPLFWRE
jgi:translation initiation factor 3 subunit B